MWKINYWIFCSCVGKRIRWKIGIWFWLRLIKNRRKSSLYRLRRRLICRKIGRICGMLCRRFCCCCSCFLPRRVWLKMRLRVCWILIKCLKRTRLLNWKLKAASWKLCNIKTTIWRSRRTVRCCQTRCLSKWMATNTAFKKMKKTQPFSIISFQMFKKTFLSSCTAVRFRPLSLTWKYWKNRTLRASMCSWNIPLTLVAPTKCWTIKASWLYRKERQLRGRLIQKIRTILRCRSREVNPSVFRVKENRILVFLKK